MELAPLEGFSIGVTADRRRGEQVELLRRRGARVVEGPSIETSYLGNDERLRRATSAVIERPPDYLVATTGIGMRAWLEAAQSWGLDLALHQALTRSKVLARGPKAAGAVTGAGLGVWWSASTEQMDDVVSELARLPLRGARVAVQLHGEESHQLRRLLVSSGADHVEVPVYTWRLPADQRPALRLLEATVTRRLHAVTFTTGPAVRNLFTIAASHGLEDSLRSAFNSRVLAACVGPVCAEMARSLGVLQPVAPELGRLGLLVRTLSDELASTRRLLQLGGVEVVLQGDLVLLDGERVRLRHREAAVLDALAERPETVLSRATLLKAVWGERPSDPHVVDVTVARLRRQLGAPGLALRTLPRRGYRLVTDASSSSEPLLGAGLKAVGQYAEP